MTIIMINLYSQKAIVKNVLFISSWTILNNGLFGLGFGEGKRQKTLMYSGLHHRIINNKNYKCVVNEAGAVITIYQTFVATIRQPVLLKDNYFECCP